MERSWKVPEGGPVDLTASEQKLFDDVRDRYDALMDIARAHGTFADGDIPAMGAVASKLHKSLAKRGHEPQHHKYMLKNRGIKPGAAGFYDHMHSVEDLLRFIGNRSANQDPVDVTIGAEFVIAVYSRRWGHDDHYHVVRKKKGWIFKHFDEIATGKDARVKGKDGSGLFAMFDHESINYPADLPGYFAYLWGEAAESGLTNNELQDALNELAFWVSQCDRTSPSGAVLRGYK